MHSASKPETNFAYFFTLCSHRKKSPIKENLISKLPDIDKAASRYDTRASNRELHEMQSMLSTTLFPVTKDNLEKLYTTQMVGKTGPGRGEYDRILAEAKKRRCCFCSCEDPTELDHFLPKSVFPEFSILPINLVPSCSRCNKLKAESTPISVGNTYIHPYYEEYNDIIWLEANLHFDYAGEITITYRIAQSLKTNQPILATKFEYQFNELELNQRYSLKASEELSNIEYRLRELKNDAGVEEVKKHLWGEAQSRFRVNRNSWQSALYYCLYQSERFCQMLWNI